jgi:hypothetical protein
MDFGVLVARDYSLIYRLHSIKRIADYPLCGPPLLKCLTDACECRHPLGRKWRQGRTAKTRFRFRRRHLEVLRHPTQLLALSGRVVVVTLE